VPYIWVVVALQNIDTSVTPNNGGTVNPSGGSFKNGADVTLIATPAKYYEFAGWGGDVSDSTERITLKMNTDKNVVASFKKIMYNLQSNVNPLGGGTLDRSSGSFEAGNNIKIIATPASGYRFGDWGGSATGNSNQIDLFMDNNKNITANFIKQYTLKISSNPSIGGTINQGNNVFDAGTQVKLSATQTFPYAFSNWSGTDNNDINPTIVTMNTDKSIVCNFIEVSAGEWKTEYGSVYRGVLILLPWN
jgi:hypothetical protein